MMITCKGRYMEYMDHCLSSFSFIRVRKCDKQEGGETEYEWVTIASDKEHWRSTDRIEVKKEYTMGML